MATNRRIVFTNDYYYHIFNRSLERKPIFANKRDFERMMAMMDYYRFDELDLPFSKYKKMSVLERTKFMTRLKTKPTQVQVLAWCLMPNHFHILVKQAKDKGITRYLSKVTNSYSKYFNTKSDRHGPLFESRFKAVLVETDDQLIHISRYIHLNPVTTNMIKADLLDSFEWSSLPDYLGQRKNGFVTKDQVLSNFKTIQKYQEFVHDQITYAKELHKIRHLIF